MEVLIAMFVLSIGLLGVAALIPVGRLGIVEAGKADRSGACGRAALGEIKTRRMLDYRFWAAVAPPPLWWDAVRYPALPPGPNPTGQPAQIPSLDAFVIDPLGVARALPTPGVASDVIPRLTLTYVANRPTPAEQIALAERIFMWHDDLEFSLPKDMRPSPPGESQRPRAPDASGVPQAAGKYTWLLTVVPAVEEASLAVADKTLFSVSVVVIFSRDYSLTDTGQPKGEHIATVRFLGQGYGGGSVELLDPIPADPPLRLRENEWIMLYGKVPDPRFNPQQRTVCKWYRIVSADSQSPTHYVSLVGPDWDMQWCSDLDGDGVAREARAVAVDHVVGVYSTTVELDRNLLWNK
jgi:hypothetical protein